MVHRVLRDHCPVCLSVMLVYYGQVAGWIKMPLGREVGLDPGDIVLDGDPAPRERGTAPPLSAAHVYCGYGRPSHLLLSSCLSGQSKTRALQLLIWATVWPQ